VRFQEVAWTALEALKLKKVATESMIAYISITDYNESKIKPKLEG